jgi:hypothetical protein
MVVDRLRRSRRKGQSGKYLVSTGLVVLTAGMFTDTLGRQVGLAALRVSVLEVGLLVLGVALGRLLVRAVIRKLKRSAIKGLAIGGLSLGIGLPALPAIASVPFVGRIAKRLPYDAVTGRLPWFGTTRYQRLLRALGGKRGLGTGSLSATLFVYGHQAGKLSEVHDVFGHRLSLSAVFGLLAVPGTLIYIVRNA